MAGPWCSLHRLKRDTAHLWWAQALPPCSAQAVPSARAVSGLLRNGCSAIHCSSKPPQRNNYLPHHLAPSLSPRPGTLHYSGEKHRESPGWCWGQSGGTGTCCSGRPPFPIHFVGCVLSLHIHTFAVWEPLQLPHAVCHCPATHAALPHAPPGDNVGCNPVGLYACLSATMQWVRGCLLGYGDFRLLLVRLTALGNQSNWKSAKDTDLCICKCFIYQSSLKFLFFSVSKQTSLQRAFDHLYTANIAVVGNIFCYISKFCGRRRHFFFTDWYKIKFAVSFLMLLWRSKRH